MLSVYSLEKTEQWDSVVRTFVEYDVYWLSGYVKAFQIHGDGDPLLFLFEGYGVRAMNVVMKRDISKMEPFSGKIESNAYFDFSTPYGYGGWLIEGETYEQLFTEYEEWCLKNGVISEFVRFHPVLKNHLYVESAYVVVFLGETVVVNLNSPEAIWSNITSKNRNVIRKAQKNGIKIYNGNYPDIYDKFKVIYNDTMDKDNAEEYYYFEEEFYMSILDDLPQNAQVFYATLDSKVIAASIIIAANGKQTYHLSGSLKEYANLAPTNLLLYKAALWGGANGCKTFHLGGGVGSREDNLFKFKRAFCRGVLNKFFIGKKIINQEVYNKLICLRSDIPANNGYFPEYRLAGDKVSHNK